MLQRGGLTLAVHFDKQSECWVVRCALCVVRCALCGCPATSDTISSWTKQTSVPFQQSLPLGADTRLDLRGQVGFNRRPPAMIVLTRPIRVVQSDALQQPGIEVRLDGIQRNVLAAVARHTSMDRLE